MAAVLDAFASKLADILVGMAKAEVEMLLGVPGEITKLETTLGDLSSILADADRRRIRDSAAERWVRELKDVMYDADDILDLCQIMEGGVDPSSSSTAPKSSSRSRCFNIPAMFSCFRNPVVAHEIGRKILALNQRLVDLEKRSSRYGFITQAINSSGYSTNKATDSLSDSNRKTGSGIVRSDVVGEKIEQDTKKIVDLLVKKVDAHVGLNKNNVVISTAIIGVGGIGKTTLARMVYNDNIVGENFDKRIWLSVNKEVNQIGVLQNIIAALGNNYGGSVGDKALLEDALKEVVRQKKFLLVMDDVWSESEHVWSEILRVSLNYGAPGSRVLVTTRNDQVAHKMKAQHLHRVEKLEEEDAWILLKKQVSKFDLLNMDRQIIEDIGRKIVKRCDGLPLAIKVVGGALLEKSRTRDAWMNVSNHYTWSIAGIADNINRAVYLSYEELPSHLKHCFLYCSLFPKNKLIISGVIVQLWIAEGYLHNKMNSMLPEDLGFEYYKELVSRNLLEPDKKAYDHSGCTMHDVVHSFAQYITKDEGVLVSKGQNIDSTLSTLKLRHLSISNKAAEWDALRKQASLRTLMLFGSTAIELRDLLNNLSCLRVLLLHNVNLVEAPDSICHLKHLRCLFLSGTSISTIPQGIGDLTFLQAIDLSGCINISQLPNSILKLRKLRSLNIRRTAITSVPRGFGKLEDLIILYGFPTHSDDSADGWCSLEELGPLSNLKRLEIRGLEKASSGSVAAKAMLSSKHHLTELDLIFTSRLGGNWKVEDNISKEEHERINEVLGNLCPQTCIELLSINGYFGSGLPQWTRSMSAFGSLRRLELEDYACCMQLPNGLGQLPFLDFLWIMRAPSVQCVGHDFLLPSSGGEGGGKGEASVTTGKRIDRRHPHHISCGAGVAFPKLTRLGFVGMLGWTEWDWEKHVPAMPALESLQITTCRLQHLPAGLAYHACRLTELNLGNIPHLVSVENFPSLVKLWSYDNPRIERISNNPSLQWIHIVRCPRIHVLQDLPSLRNIEWEDLDAEAVPQYLQESELNKLRLDCSLSLLKLIALQDDSSEWGKIQHVQQLKAFGRKSKEDKVDRHIFYTREPYSFEADMGESTGA
ncbi:putative disease resistance RPP13-like protein 1 [Phragmites australis]|uniref:putative disease resistance RPP13-like protein 1 n=1 Tax=Phragmites australis TaxID=29695 RepID=UPI002D76C2AA|nr:putative disease resistance RPP13-like protein 1 [Phragmites australis]